MERSKKSIRLPGELLEQMRPLIAKRNITFTNFVIEAIMNYMRVLNYQEGVDDSFGAWKDSQHYELKDGASHYVRKMRSGRTKRIENRI